MNLETLTASEIQRRVAAREESAQEVCRAALARVEALDAKLRIFLAAEVDRKLAAHEPPGPLAGVPVALKDNLCTLGFPTTCASRSLEGWRPPYNAAVVEKLRQAGAVVVGKTNLDEFAMGSSCENSAFHPTCNPWNPACVVGGSSGGSAAAVAAGLAPVALGSDTGGSIRQPAALCGVVGLKPTYGRVSRYGLVAYASSLDQIGPLAHTAEDAARVLAVIAGRDARDATSAPVEVPDYTRGLAGGVADLTLGLPREYFGEGLDPEVRRAVAGAVDVLRSQGARVRDVSLPHTEYCLAAYYLIATAEASSNLARYDGVQYGLRVPADNLTEMYRTTRAAGFGAEVKRRIMLGTYALSAGYYEAYYQKALQVRTLIQQDFTAALADCDVLVTPTSPTPAFRLGEKLDDPLTMYLSDIYTISVNLAGLPGLSLPCGFSAAGLPIGLQLIGRAFEEPTLLRTAQAYQGVTTWHQSRPSLS